jgi:hypothetical protein
VTIDGRLRLEAAGEWVPPRPPFVEEIDAETDRAVRTWRSGELQLRLVPNGAIWSDRVPFLHKHNGRLLGELQVDCKGADGFVGFGEIDPEVIAGIYAVSDGVQFRRARIVDHGYGLRWVE